MRIEKHALDTFLWFSASIYENANYIFSPMYNHKITVPNKIRSKQFFEMRKLWTNFSIKVDVFERIRTTNWIESIKSNCSNTLLNSNIQWNGRFAVNQTKNQQNYIRIKNRKKKKGKLQQNVPIYILFKYNCVSETSAFYFSFSTLFISFSMCNDNEARDSESYSYISILI